MKKQILCLFLLPLSINFATAQHDHSHEQKPSTIRESKGDFAEGELIKAELVDYTTTPIYKKISKKGELKDEYKYLDDIDIYYVVYESDGLMVTGFMSKPKKAGNYPCIIYNRGGNRDFGRLLVANAVMQMGAIAANGYVVIGSNYRGNSNSEGKEEFGGADVNDVLNLIPALGQVESADTSRIGMLGVSRGGMMTYLAMKHSDKIKAAATIGGMTNMRTTIKNRPDMESHVFAEVIPDYDANKENALDSRSAVLWTDKMNPSTPLLILHGEKDDRVSVDQARELAEQLKGNDHPVEYHEFPGDNHGITKHREEVMKLIEEWFEQHVK